MDSLSVTYNTVETANIPIVYENMGDFFQSLCGAIVATPTSETNSTSNLEELELDRTPYEYTLASGALDFWEDEEEDIYHLDNGQPI